jgi:CRISPR system Cascade subunit CasD
MSSDPAWLTLRLEGPLQSWGFDSQYNLRKTSMMPTRSGIFGLFCAALGADRGSAEEQRILGSLAKVKMTTIAIPRKVRGRSLPMRRITDYHTVMGTRKADGGLKDCHITHRYYLADAAFGVLLEGILGNLQEVAQGLQDPRWGLWLGRKCCVPSAPVLVGLFQERETAIRSLLGDEPIEAFTRQEEVSEFSEGRDSLVDLPLSFHPARRRFTLRRVRTAYGPL